MNNQEPRHYERVRKNVMIAICGIFGLADAILIYDAYNAYKNGELFATPRPLSGITAFPRIDEQLTYSVPNNTFTAVSILPQKEETPADTPTTTPPSISTVTPTVTPTEKPTRTPRPTRPPTATPTPWFIDFTQLACFEPGASLEQTWGTKETTWLPVIFTKDDALTNPQLAILETVEDQLPPNVPVGVIVPQEEKTDSGSLPSLKIVTSDGKESSVLWVPPFFLSELKWTSTEDQQKSHLAEILTQYAKMWGLKEDQVTFLQDEFEEWIQINLQLRNIQFQKLPVNYFVGENRASQLPFPIVPGEEQPMVMTAVDEISGKNVNIFLSPSSSDFLSYLMTTPEDQLSEDDLAIKRGLLDPAGQKVEIEMSAGYGQDVVSEKQAQAGMTVNFPDVSGETVSIQTDSGDQEVGMEFVLGGLVVVGENIE